ncbi:MAG TPA: glycosyltransferase family 2 protein [Solirubrobacterales bacterium]|nr:glycosyltransferase family 2 protein [Solirubrobacterales bacterium]
MRPSLSVLIVAYDSRDDLARTLPALLPELGEGDELIVVDNKPGDGSVELVRELAPAARTVQPGGNTGFAGGCNAGAEVASGDLLVILNPDAAPQPGFGEAIRRPWVEGRGWGAWQALVADGSGERINSAGNPVHFTGIVWAGGHGRPLAQAPPAGEVPAASGACLAVPTSSWREVGGFPEEFFMYHEDVDISVRLRSAGRPVGIEPTAVVVHDYEFAASAEKWLWLERNRLAFLVRTYPGALLALLAPALLATELALLLVAAAGGWGGQKLRANLQFLRWLPRLLRERRQVQAARTVSAAKFASWLTPDLDSELISPLVRTWPARALLRGYWRLVRWAVRSGGSGSR